MSESSSSTGLLSIIVVLLVAVLLAVTKPSEEAHRNALASDFSRQRPVAGAVGLGALSATAPTYHAVVFGSYTSLGDRVTTIGALGMVWVLELDSESPGE